MKRITRDQVLDLEICYGHYSDYGYSRARASTWLDKAWPEGRDSISIKEIAACEKLSIEDRIWAIQRLVSPRVVRLFACDCAERVLARLPEAERARRSVEAIEVSRKFAMGWATDGELRNAYDDAYGAYEDAADTAADATFAAAHAAHAEDAAYAANVAEDAADSVVAERRTQLDRLVEIYLEHEAGQDGDRA